MVCSLPRNYSESADKVSFFANFGQPIFYIPAREGVKTVIFYPCKYKNTIKYSTVCLFSEPQAQVSSITILKRKKCLRLNQGKV